MTGNQFAIFDTAIGRCGIVWGARGINAVQLPMSSEDKTRTRIRQAHGDIAEAPPSTEVQSAIGGIVELLSTVSPVMAPLPSDRLKALRSERQVG